MSQAILRIERDRNASGEIVRVVGELDLTNADVLGSALLDTGGETVLLDLTDVTFIDSAGIRAIDQAHSSYAGEGRALLIVAPPESRVAWTFRIAGFEQHHLLESVDAAPSDAD
jgi:anti-anti-sigma factor